MKLGIAYSTRNSVENTQATFEAWLSSRGAEACDFHWVDGSTDETALDFLNKSACFKVASTTRGIIGGADAAIAWKLSFLLDNPRYTHIGLLENDVLLDKDWLEPTMALFEKGKEDGLEVGAVSPRSYVDRVLVQRDGYAVMHNLGAGAVIFTREAARHVLNSFRTHWWADNVRLFAQISGIDLRTYAAFRGNEQWVTTDWGFDAQLARHGLASLALTPARCQMIGQVPPLESQGLELVTWTDACRNGLLPNANNDPAFELYRANLADIRAKHSRLDAPDIIVRQGGGMIFFAHQLGYLAGGPTWQGTSELLWSQGFGPFAYRAGPGGMSLAVRLSGSCSFLVAGGNDGGRVSVEDMRSAFRSAPDLPAESPIVEIVVPGGPVPRELKVSFDEGTVFSGIQTVEPQMLDTTFRFDWHQLPEAVA